MIEKEALVSSVPFWSKVYLADRSQTSHLHTWSKTWDSSPRCVSPTAMGYSAGSLHVQYQILCIQEPWNDDALSQLQRKTTEEIEDISKEGDQVNRVQIEHMQITGNRIWEATRGDPVLSHVLHFVLHGWPEEESTLILLCQTWRVYSWGWLYVAWYKSSDNIQISPGSAVRTVWWPNLDSDIKTTARHWSDCQANRCRSPLKMSNPWIWPTRSWQHSHGDIAGPFYGRMFRFVVDAQVKINGRYRHILHQCRCHNKSFMWTVCNTWITGRDSGGQWSLVCCR